MPFYYESPHNYAEKITELFSDFSYRLVTTKPTEYTFHHNTKTTNIHFESLSTPVKLLQLVLTIKTVTDLLYNAEEQLVQADKNFLRVIKLQAYVK